MEQRHGLSVDLFGFASTLVRAGDELPEAERQAPARVHATRNLPALKQRLFSPAPIYDELEIARLTSVLTKLREELGADHPFVKKVLGKRVARGARHARRRRAPSCADVEATRKQLFEGGKKAVDARRTR